MDRNIAKSPEESFMMEDKYLFLSSKREVGGPDSDSNADTSEKRRPELCLVSAEINFAGKSRSNGEEKEEMGALTLQLQHHT